MKTIPCHFEFQHTPTWCAEFYIGKARVFAMCDDRVGEASGDFERFVLERIQQARQEAIVHAHCGILIAPTNFVSQFWTPELIHKLSDALRRPYKRPVFKNLKIYLKAAWVSSGLCNMTDKELAAHLNKVYQTKSFSPAAARQTAYRLELFSTRETQGPQQRQTARSL